MPTYVNGRALGVAQNGLFHSSNTDPIPGGKLWPEAALTWNVMRADALRDGIQPWEFMPAGSRSSARARADQLFFWNHQPPPAARPYTSNHGWAIAVDVLTRRAAAWILKNGHRYGWSWDEGRRVGEWWHMRYVGTSAANLRQLRARLDPLRGLSKEEREHADRLLWHRRKYRAEARTGKGPEFHKHKRHAQDHRNWLEGRIAWLTKHTDKKRAARTRLLKRVVAATDGTL